MGKHWSCQNFLIAYKNLQHATKTASKREIQKISETTGNLIGNKIAGKLTSVSRKSKKLQINEVKDESEEPKERNISPEKRQQITDELRLV